MSLCALLNVAVAGMRTQGRVRIFIPRDEGDIVIKAMDDNDCGCVSEMGIDPHGYDITVHLRHLEGLETVQAFEACFGSMPLHARDERGWQPL